MTHDVLLFFLPALLDLLDCSTYVKAIPPAWEGGKYCPHHTKTSEPQSIFRRIAVAGRYDVVGSAAKMAHVVVIPRFEPVKSN